MENNATEDKTIRVMCALAFEGEDSTPPSEGWAPPLPYPYAASYPVTFFGVDGSSYDGGVELRFLAPSAFEERLVLGGAEEANRAFSVSSDAIASATFGEPSFVPIAPEGEA